MERFRDDGGRKGGGTEEGQLLYGEAQTREGSRLSSLPSDVVALSLPLIAETDDVVSLDQL